MPAKDGLNAAEAAAARREEARAIERQQWVTLYRTYERCVEISEKVWGAKLSASQLAQQNLAEEMRDRVKTVTIQEGSTLTIDERERLAYAMSPVEIPVPLFTPRDRQQFVKEVAATLLISADRRNLTVLFPKEVVTEPAPEVPAEAASGVEEGLDEEAGELTAQGLG